MQIVIPMSGFGERFREAGYSIPKPLIQVDSKTIIQPYFDLLNNENYKNTDNNNIDDEYDNLCINNKITEKLENYTKLIIELENINIISVGYIDIILDKLYNKSFNNIKYNDIMYNYLCIINNYKIVLFLINYYYKFLYQQTYNYF